MKQLAVILFSLLLFIQTGSKWLLVLGYTINKEYIAKNLCENRFRPALHCNGQCQLMKKLAAEDQSNKANENLVAKLPPVDIIASAGFSVLSLFTQPAPRSFNSRYILKKYTVFSSPAFRPPLPYLLA